MEGDGFIESIRSIVRRVLDDRDRIDFGRRYPAKVVIQSADLLTVDCVFDDSRLASKTQVPVAGLPGRAQKILPGTRVAIGWLGGDERYPRAYLEWDGSGGLDIVTDSAQTSWEWDTPLGTFSTDLKTGHLLNGMSLDMTSVVVGIAAGSNGAITGVSGGDVLATVKVQVADAMGMPPPGPLFTLTFKRAFASTPQVFVSDGGTKATALAMPAGVIVSVPTPLVDATAYTVTLMIVG